MAIGIEKSKVVRDLLRSMLRAWNDLAKADGRDWSAPAAFAEQPLETPEQLAHLIAEVIFHRWKKYALGPGLKEDHHRGSSSSDWVQRMVAPISARAGESSMPESDIVTARVQTSRRTRDGHPIGSRYLRVQTIPPDRIRYGRSPAAPAPAPPPLASPPPHTEALASTRRPTRPTIRHSRRLSTGSINGTIPMWPLRDDTEQQQHMKANTGNRDVLESCSSGESEGGRGCDRGIARPAVVWNDVKLWEQGPAGWMASEARGVLGNGGGRARDPVISAKVLRQVATRLHRSARLEDRQTRAVATCREAFGRAPFKPSPAVAISERSETAPRIRTTRRGPYRFPKHSTISSTESSRHHRRAASGIVIVDNVRGLVLGCSGRRLSRVGWRREDRWL